MLTGARFFPTKFLIQYSKGAIIRMTLTGCELNETASIFEAVFVLAPSEVGEHSVRPQIFATPTAELLA